MNTTEISGTPPAIASRHPVPTHEFEPFRMEEIETVDRFEQQVRRYSDRLAVRSRSHQFTYAGLNETANRVAHAILDQRGEAEEPVVVLLEQGAS